MSKVSSSHNIRRKQLSTHGLHEPKTLAGLAKEPNDEAVTQQTPLDSKKLSVESKAAQRLSAGAAAVEKSSTEAKSVKEPRQTRTSSLRARISAGQVIKDSPNKVLGFTDFTAEKTSTAKASNGEGFRTKSSTSFGKAFTKKPSKEFQGGKRAPAQFVAGSRRPVARRSSSRNSLRGDSRAPSPVLLEPSRLAPPIPTAKVAATRKSSIPVSRYSVSSTSAEDDSQSQPTTGPTSRQQTKPSNETSENGGTYHISTKDQGREAFASRPADEDATLESIAESPQSTSNPKRLSIRESGYGYKLKIDPSADRLIMGDEDSDKENQPLMKKKSKDLFRAALINEHKNCAKDHKWASGRPMSSQGFTESQSRNASTATEMRTKKVNSVDLSCVSLGMATTQTEGDNIKKATSPIEDLFSGVTGSRGKNATHTEEQGTAENTRDGVDTVQAISPVKESPTSMSDATTGVLAFMPEILQQDVNKSSFVDGTARVDEVKFCKTVRLDTHLPQASNPNAPSTPQHGTQNNGSPSSGSFPPRSSSRMKHPDYTINGSTTSSSMSPVERAAAQLQKKISLTEPKPSDGEISHEMSNHSQGEISSQTILADVGRKRDSAANESTKSQTSMSKGLMSNFRGLFHKRTSDNIDFPNLRSTKKSSKRPSVTAHGSPFHSLSNIHPVHRPTQASINRNSATSQRPNSNGIAPATPGTPAFASPIPSEVSTTTTLAMEILNSARRETSSPKKERLLELGRLVVDTITQARDAEKAMEEAKQAARKAEVVHALCKKSVSDVAHMVKDWRSDVAHL